MSLLLASLAVLSSSSAPQQGFQNDAQLRQQIIRNTETIRNLEYRLEVIERGGSDLATATAQRVAVLETQLAENNARHDRLEKIVEWMIAFGVAQLGALLLLTVRYFMEKNAAIQHSRRLDEVNGRLSDFHDQLNSRLDEMLRMIRAEGVAEGRKQQRDENSQ